MCIIDISMGYGGSWHTVKHWWKKYLERYTWAVNKTYTIVWQVSHKVTEEIYTYHWDVRGLFKLLKREFTDTVIRDQDGLEIRIVRLHNGLIVFTFIFIIIIVWNHVYLLLYRLTTPWWTNMYILTVIFIRIFRFRRCVKVHTRSNWRVLHPDHLSSCRQGDDLEIPEETYKQVLRSGGPKNSTDLNIK